MVSRRHGGVGDGGEVGDERAETMDRQVVVGAFGGGLAVGRQVVIGNGDGEVLGHLVTADTLPTASAILSWPRNRRLARRTRAWMCASFCSVASSSSRRLRARSSASSGLRQTRRRSPG